ncbi:MAG: RsbRD N-terminal domain-containing protein [Planctomycetota bacterium]
MKLDDLLNKKKKAILAQWLDKVQKTYPADTSRFLKNEKDRFQNPVGHTMAQDLGDVFSALLDHKPVHDLAPLLEYFIKIRSIQEFTPSQAVGFAFQLKEAVRDNLREEIEEGRICADLLEFESSLDDMALLAFENYMNCREKLFELKTKQRQQGPLKMVSRPVLSCRRNDEKDRKNGET